MKEIKTLAIIFILGSCSQQGWPENWGIEPGFSLGGIRLGEQLKKEEIHEIRTRLVEKGIFISIDKNNNIQSIATDRHIYKIKEKVGVGSSLEEIKQVLGNPILVDGEDFINSSSPTNFKGFISYRGLSIGFRDGKAVMLIVTKEKIE